MSATPWRRRPGHGADGAEPTDTCAPRSCTSWPRTSPFGPTSSPMSLFGARGWTRPLPGPKWRPRSRTALHSRGPLCRFVPKVTDGRWFKSRPLPQCVNHGPMERAGRVATWANPAARPGAVRGAGPGQLARRAQLITRERRVVGARPNALPPSRPLTLWTGHGDLPTLPPGARQTSPPGIPATRRSSARPHSRADDDASVDVRPRPSGSANSRADTSLVHGG